MCGSLLIFYPSTAPIAKSNASHNLKGKGPIRGLNNWYRRQGYMKCTKGFKAIVIKDKRGFLGKQIA